MVVGQAAQWRHHPGPTTDTLPGRRQAAAHHLAMARSLAILEAMAPRLEAMVHHLEATAHHLATALLRNSPLTEGHRQAWAARRRRHSGRLDHQDMAYQQLA